MTTKQKLNHTAYMQFERAQWSALRNNVALTLSEQDLEQLQGINESLSLDEVVDIYLPLSRLLNLYVETQQYRHTVRDKFLNSSNDQAPYIIGIAGSVAVGKSTTARILQALLSRWPQHPKVALVTTDGFLRPNQELVARNLMHKKGFPESFDIKALVNFVAALKSGKESVTAPIYSHLTYDILPDKKLAVEKPDIVILEGLNVLQTAINYPKHPHRVFVSDFVDFSIFVDADTDLLKRWYIQRFLKFREGAFTDPNAYFHSYSKMSESEAIEIAGKIWDEINGLNLQENIRPTRDRANLILKKATSHQVSSVKLRK
ncbi:type I pantothenate kinase [Psychromonas sp. psych-6C06]|uniref:type I pantothenate kinase n=1 Tax=Psychromonas sp. psych-6C06 TaxID=2058089 RepID=UPI000C34EC8C|nr:type I pantothenate kinase [Psychromonas sp. psych-6C06]PKF60757.1 type I pantothenate kinase [Psychromonas sp. psych-6C06]